MDETQGEFSASDVSAQRPLFAPLHATVDMFLREWTSRYNDYVNTTWGFPYKNAFNVFFLDDPTYEGINGNDTIASAWPIDWQDVGWAELGSDEAMRKVTHIRKHTATWPRKMRRKLMCAIFGITGWSTRKS
jgi:hypothetical protein